MMNGMQKAVAGAFLVITGAACSTTGDKHVGLAEQVPPVSGPQEPGVAAAKTGDSGSMADLKQPKADTQSAAVHLTPKEIDVIVQQRGGYKPEQVAKLTPVEKAELAYAFKAFDQASMESVSDNAETAAAASRRASAAMNQIVNAQTSIMVSHPEMIPAASTAQPSAAAAKADSEAASNKFDSAAEQRRAVARGLLGSNGHRAERTPVRVASQPESAESELAAHDSGMARGERANERLGQKVTEAELRERIAQLESAAGLSRMSVARENTGIAAGEIDIINGLVELEARDQQMAFEQLDRLRATTTQYTHDAIQNRRELHEMGIRTAQVSREIENSVFNQTQVGLPGFLGFLYHEVSDGGSRQVAALNRNYQELSGDGLRRVQSQEAAADELRASSVQLVHELRRGSEHRKEILKALAANRARDLISENRQIREKQ